MIATIKLEELNPKTVSTHGVVRMDIGRVLSPEELVEIATGLGKPQAFNLRKYRPADFPPEVTLIDTHGTGMNAAPRGFGEGWHQDSTYTSNPPEFTVLHSVQVPESGGETLFADTRPAVLELSELELTQLSELTLVHALGSTYRISQTDAGKTLDELVSGLPKARHPLVRQYPHAGTTLYLSPLYTKDTLDPSTRALFDRLLSKVLKGQLAHKWKTGELVVWDNRVVLHAASPYLGEARRCMLRVVVHDVGGVS